MDLPLSDFPLKSSDKIRYSDTDRQGHVNNAVFSTFLETGRVEILYDPSLPILSNEASFVIASLQINFLREITWPGEVMIGTGIKKIGNSSIHLYQMIFQDGECAAEATTVIVQTDDEQGGGKPLTEAARRTLGTWLLP